ncbi:hypothetical protein, partial [Desulfonatronospira sp.]|uniref:hypothetical protein n=1 Tax=Desulfonatronospira sp. TaxID=1962951 RepID=UPI0025C69596
LVPRLQPGNTIFLWLQPHFEEAAGAARTKRSQAGAWERGVSSGGRSSPHAICKALNRYPEGIFIHELTLQRNFIIDLRGLALPALIFIMPSNILQKNKCGGACPQLRQVIQFFKFRCSVKEDKLRFLCG